MSVEALNVMGDEGTRWQGYVVDGAYPVGRPLGCSKHGGVYMTSSAADGRDVAIKLVPAVQGEAEVQLRRWARARRLAHPHLLPLLEFGGCQLDGLAYLYLVMEYADQTLAQLLLQRALTPEEAREMLLPVLHALAFLHDQGLVHGGLRPSNVLVVGDQLKLASDTIGQQNDATFCTRTASAYDPPEGVAHGRTTAADIWALGMCLSEALSRRSTAAPAGHHPETAMLPVDTPPGLRKVVGGCLAQRPQDRPSVKQLAEWLGDQPLMPSPMVVFPPEACEPPDARSATVPQAITAPSEEIPRQPVARAAGRRGWQRVTLVAALLLAMGGAVYLHRHRIPPALATIAPAPPPPAPMPLPATAREPLAAPSATEADRLATPGVAVHEEIPVLPRRAARSIHGHARVSVQAVIDPDGSVSGVTLGRGDRRRILQKLAVKAARRWTFAPVQAGSSTLMEIRFDFARDGCTAQAFPVPKNAAL